MNITDAHNLAIVSAGEAVEAFRVKYGKEEEGAMSACGFAWVKAVVDGRSAAARELKKLGFSKAWNYGYDLWNPSGYNGQNINEKEAGADAYVRVMRERTGLEFHSQSRMD